ncbi:integrase [Chelativorans sp. YIM 93263]|uniref:integrase n=1 Tax=Chelativorans sp. YIM 93263 TaxID=2906648 RepID=UPI002378E2CC|nr:integrase [Chelativorans sp. YIM 93263]
MAARHRIANLTRRGNVFYWRARIPAGVTDRRLPSHLSLSLRHSDHMKAGYMARRLNTLLAELTMRPDVRMTTREQLEQLFRSEIDRMTDHLDDLVFAARRTGSDPKESLRADLEVGWAYRLVELFGTTRSLTFEEGCPGRDVLERAGVLPSAIPAIATTFRQEQAECRSPRFERTLAAEMEKHGIPDTMVNREKATMQLMRAKAEVLLDIGGRYGPETDGLTADSGFAELAQDRQVIVGQPGRMAPILSTDNDQITTDTPPEIISNSQANTGSARDVPSDAVAAVHEFPSHADRFLPRLQAADHNTVDLPLERFMEECEALIKSQQHSWEPKTAQDVRVAVRMLVGILEEQGVRRSGELSQFHIGQLRSHFDHIPRRYGQSARLRALSTKELREAAARQADMAKARGEEPPSIGLQPATIRKHLAKLLEFLNFLRGRGYRLAPVTMDGLRPKKTKAGELRLLTDKPGPEVLRKMFRLAVFTGCKGPEEQEIPGSRVFHSANYFVPMLLAYLGPRRGEVAGLAIRDVVETQNGWAIHIRPNAYRRVKNAQSVRMLPVPDEVLRLNFLEYVDEIKALGYGMLFPELFSANGKNDPGDRFYKDFIPLLKKGLDDEKFWNRALHALRHGQADTLKQAAVDESKINDISGRLGQGETSLRYTNPAGLPLIRSVLARYPTITDHLEPRPVQLLPWVAERRPAPWQGRTRRDRLREARSRRGRPTQ